MPETPQTYANIGMETDVAVFRKMTFLFLEGKFLPVFSVFGKSAPTDAEGIVSNLMFAVKSTHQPRHTERGGLSPRSRCVADCFPHHICI